MCNIKCLKINKSVNNERNIKSPKLHAHAYWGQGTWKLPVDSGKQCSSR